eukprot:superscaffoldBa00000360_g4094
MCNQAGVWAAGGSRCGKVSSPARASPSLLISNLTGTWLSSTERKNDLAQHYAEIPGSLSTMLELGSCSVSSQSLTGDHNALGLPRTSGGPECPDDGLGLGMGEMCGSSTPRRQILHTSPVDCESWQKHRAGLVRGSSLFSGSHSLLEPLSLSTSYDTLYLPHTSAHAPPLHQNRLGLSLDVTSSFEVGGGMLGVDGDLVVSPNVMKRRRGGLIEQRDIVKAHQAHKIQSTPQARRKEWE